jgi:hypothetical protein
MLETNLENGQILERHRCRIWRKLWWKKTPKSGEQACIDGLHFSPDIVITRQINALESYNLNSIIFVNDKQSHVFGHFQRENAVKSEHFHRKLLIRQVDSLIEQVSQIDFQVRLCEANGVGVASVEIPIL